MVNHFNKTIPLVILKVFNCLIGLRLLKDMQTSWRMHLRKIHLKFLHLLACLLRFPLVSLAPVHVQSEIAYTECAN